MKEIKAPNQQMLGTALPRRPRFATFDGEAAVNNIGRMVILVVVTTSCLAAAKKTEPDLGTPRSAVTSFRDAVSRRDWRTAEKCLALDLREVLKDAMSDRTFFDQYVTDGFSMKTLPLLPANLVSSEGLAQLSLLEHPGPPDGPVGPLPHCLTAGVASGGGSCPWIAQCTFVKEKDGWKLTVGGLKTKQDFLAWYSRAIPAEARGRAKELEGRPVEQPAGADPAKGGPAQP